MNERGGVAPDLTCYSDKTVAKMLDCSERTVQRLQEAGKLKTIVLGKRGKRTLHTSLVEFLEQ